MTSIFTASLVISVSEPYRLRRASAASAVSGTQGVRLRLLSKEMSEMALRILSTIRLESTTKEALKFSEIL